MDAAPGSALTTLITSLRRQPPVHEAFHELRWRRALREPLQVSGVLSWHGDMAFVREVRQPYQEHSRLEQGNLIQQRQGSAGRSVPLHRAPELRVLFEGLSALFAGDHQAFTALFQTGLVQAGTEPGNQAWRLDLTPHESSLRNRVPALSFHGTGQQARCLVLHQRNAQTLIVLDDLPLPPAPDAAASASTRSRSSAAITSAESALQARIDQLCPLPENAGNPGANAAGTGR